jgi:hypothetical protein
MEADLTVDSPLPVDKTSANHEKAILSPSCSGGGGRSARGVSYRWQFLLSTVLMLLLVWLASGTMSPYAATLKGPIVLPCGYLANIDHIHFKATFLLLDGADSKDWAFSVVLRRMLFPLLSYPAMKLWGFELGGIVTSMLLLLVAFVSFITFVRRQIGEVAAKRAMWLLATYPGITYWGGLPYSYSAIVPCSLFALMLLWRLNNSRDARSVLFLSLGLGVLFVGYDLFPFFGLAAILIVLSHRLYLKVPLVVVGALVPQMLVWTWLKSFHGVDLRNSNTEPLYTIPLSYLHRPDFGKWAALLGDVPRVGVYNFLFSNFLFLPLLFVLLYGLNRWKKQMRLHPVEKMVLCAGLFVFLFNNMAPPYEGWQMRGDWISRLYQPTFTALLLFSARALQFASGWSRGLKTTCMGLFLVTVLLQGLFSAGPILNNPLAGPLFFRFYKHHPTDRELGEPDSLARNLEAHGRRPLGFCRP